jgi:hypothetical protein
MLLEVYVMAIESGIEMDNIGEGFLNERMTIALKSSSLFVRKLYHELTKFSRTARHEMNTNEVINNLLALAIELENRVIERRIVTNDLN